MDELLKYFAGVGGMPGRFSGTRAEREQQIGTPERRLMFKKAAQLAYGDRELIDSRVAAGVALLGSVGAGGVMLVLGWVLRGVWDAIF